MNILPNFNSMAQLSPTFSGNYNIALNNRYSKFKIYEVGTLSNGNPNYEDTSTLICSSQKVNGIAKCDGVYLDNTKNYILVADLLDNVGNDNICGRYDIVRLEVELAKTNVTLGDNDISLDLENEYLEFNSATNVNYRFTVGNTNIPLHLLDSNFNVIKTSVNGELIVVLNANETYYFRLDKTNSAINNVLLNIKDEMYVYFENIEGITNPIDAMMTISPGMTVSLPIPNKDGYTFSGWWNKFDELDPEIHNGNIFNFMRPELHLIAKWTPIVYNIYYIENGASEINDGTYTIEHVANLNQEITRDNFVFCGWYDNSSLSGNEIITLPQGTMGDKTFYAKWVKSTFNITFDLNVLQTDNLTGTFDNPSDIVNNKKVVYYNKPFTLPNPTLFGFIFDGWYYNESEFTSKDPYTYESDITIVAKWNRENYYIKIGLQDETGTLSYKWLKSNGADFIWDENGNNSLSFNTLSPNNYVTQLKLDGYTNANHYFLASLYKNGHKFVSFVHDANAATPKVFDWSNLTKEQIQPGNIIALQAYYVPEADFKIYIESIKGVEDAQGNLPPKNYNEEINYMTAPTLIGHTFSHYIVSNNTGNSRFKGELATGETFSFTRMPDLSQNEEFDGRTIYLIPIFTATSYTVSFANTVSYLQNKIVVFGSSYNSKNYNAFPIPIRNNYTFEGWYTGTNGTGDQKVDKDGAVDNWKIPNDCILYARWSYLVSFNANGGSGEPSVKAIRINRGEKGTLATSGTLSKTGYTFAGWNTNSSGTGTNGSANSLYSNNTGNETLYAKWDLDDFNIFFDKQGGTGGTGDTTATYTGKLPEITAPSRTGYIFLGYFIDTNENSIQYYQANGESVRNWDMPYNATLYAQWEIKTYSLTFYVRIPSGAEKSIHHYSVNYGTKIEKSATAPDFSEYVFKHWEKDGNVFSSEKNISISIQYITFSHKYYAIYEDKACLAEGSLITLADGSQVAVESLTGNERLLVWNLKTGKFDTAPILFIDSDPSRAYEVINLTFSDGTSVKVISEHAFWDIDLNRYVFMRNDAAQYIGHTFNKQTTDARGNMTWTAVELTNVVITNETTTAWSPVTYEHLCYYVNGMLSMPGGIENLINFFDVDAETMQYDRDAMQADIEEFGLFTYEEFTELVPISIEVFNAFDVQYYKVATGKGLLTIDEVVSLVERYSEFFTSL